MCSSPNDDQLTDSSLDREFFYTFGEAAIYDSSKRLTQFNCAMMLDVLLHSMPGTLTQHPSWTGLRGAGQIRTPAHYSSGRPCGIIHRPKVVESGDGNLSRLPFSKRPRQFPVVGGAVDGTLLG